MGDDAKMVSGEVIGIDLGTTFSCVAVARKGHAVEIIANDQGNRTTPSYAAFSAGSERLIGESAKNQATVNPSRTIFDVKRLIGKKYNDPEIQNDLKYLPYPIVAKDGKPCVEIEVNGELKLFTPEEISAMVLRKMKETAETYLGKQVTNAVVTVPAYFNDSQRQATKDAGLNVVRIINEPTAAALAYGVNQDSNTKKSILVYDLGGGTFDVSVLEIQKVVKYFMDIIKSKYNKDISGDPKALGKLRRECERAKRVLSSQTQTTIEIDYFIEGMDFSEPLTRAKFEDLNSGLFERTMEVVNSTLKDADVEEGDIDEIVLVGGSTRIPKIREMLKETFYGKEPSKGINPDEAVAFGAAVLGATRSSDRAGVGAVLFDVTPLSLGISVFGGLMSVVVPRNTVIPTKISDDEYTTVYDQQTRGSIKIFQGERALTMDCLLLGSFMLTGITPAPRGVANVEVTFEIDADGILSVTAMEKGTENSESLTIGNYKRNLSRREIERMVREAMEMAEQDKKERERVQARNQLERSIYDLNKAVAEKLHMYDGDKTMVEKTLREASEWLVDNMNASMQAYKDRGDIVNLVKKMLSRAPVS